MNFDADEGMRTLFAVAGEGGAAREAELGMLPEPDHVARFAPMPLPEYVKHDPEAPRSGMLSAQAVVQEYERAAKQIEALGEDLQKAVKHTETMQAVLGEALKNLEATARQYREEAARVFNNIERCTKLAASVTVTCNSIRENIKQAVDN